MPAPAIRLHDGWWVPTLCSGPGKFLRRAQAIPYALRFWEGPRRLALQAGAHIGVWPSVLAQHFARVTCWEPGPDNWACLQRNLADTPAVTCQYGALGATRGTVDVSIQPHSTGGHHVALTRSHPYVTVPLYTIDGQCFDEVDAIFLDTEGFEIPILEGAAQTIAVCRPLLVLENNGCSRKYGHDLSALPWYLAERHRYREVGTVGEDAIFVLAPEERL